MVENLQKIEQERERLHQLLDSEASPEEILQQSEKLDKLIVEYYRSQKQTA